MYIVIAITVYIPIVNCIPIKCLKHHTHASCVVHSCCCSELVSRELRPADPTPGGGGGPGRSKYGNLACRGCLSIILYCLIRRWLSSNLQFVAESGPAHAAFHCHIHIIYVSSPCTVWSPAIYLKINDGKRTGAERAFRGWCSKTAEQFFGDASMYPYGRPREKGGGGGSGTIFPLRAPRPFDL